MATSAVNLLKQLSSKEIRDRLAALEAEERALRTLLRAAEQIERKHVRRRAAGNA